jgi:hypothetical protein
MTKKVKTALLALIAFPLAAVAVDVANLTGTWLLNVDKSTWGKARRPHSVVIQVEHNEPHLTYHGTVVDVTGENTRGFGFDGAIDGNEYPMTRSFGAGRIVITRTDARTFTSVFKTNDGLYTEATTTTISEDGKVLVRKIRVLAPDGKTQWTEVYEKR